MEVSLGAHWVRPRHPGRNDEEKNSSRFGIKTLTQLGDKILGPWIVVKRSRKCRVLHQTLVETQNCSHMWENPQAFHLPRPDISDIIATHIGPFP